MGRRSRDQDIGALVAQWGGFLLLGAIVMFGGRGVVIALGLVWSALLVVGLAFVGGCTLHWVRNRSERSRDVFRDRAVKLTVSMPVTSSVQQEAAPVAALGVATPLSSPVSSWSWFLRNPILKPPAAREKPEEENVLAQLRQVDWFQFEKVIALMYRRQGYEVRRRGGANPDGGIDLLITKAGETKAVQCKQWESWNVGVKAVREFLGALTDAGIARGVFVTLRGYTGEAKELAEKHGIEILNEKGVAAMLAASDVEHDVELWALLRDKRKLCPKCERQMVLRTARRGADSGSQFWGCSGYPRCRYTMPATRRR